MSKSGTNIRVCVEVHTELVSYLTGTDRKIGKFTETAIREKIEKELKEKKVKI